MDLNGNDGNQAYPDDLDLYFRFRCNKGLLKRGLHKKKEYKERLNYEIEVIRGESLSGYFLVVQDIVTWALSNRVTISPGRGCFMPGSYVVMANGDKKQIQEIQPGDTVLSHDGTPNKVKDVLEYEVSEELLELSFECGTRLVCTKDHEILTKNRGWTRADQLSEIDEVAMIW
jgi:hypothetical protein